MRLQAQTALIEAGKVFLPSSAPWLDAYLHELMMFPATRQDDQVDSTTPAFAYLSEEVDGYYAFIKLELAQSRYRDFPVRGDHPQRDIEFKLTNGRRATRERDGYYYFTENEWLGIPAQWALEQDYRSACPSGQVECHSSSVDRSAIVLPLGAADIRRRIGLNVRKLQHD